MARKKTKSYSEEYRRQVQPEMDNGYYLYLVNEKWLYLAAVMDLFSRTIVDWSLATHMTDELICDAFEVPFITGMLEKI